MLTAIEIKIVAAIAAIFLLATAGLGLVAYIGHEHRALAAAKSAQAVAEARVSVSTGQAGAVTSAAAIADRGAQRDALSITLHEANDHVLQSAPGASAPVDPALNAYGRRGLCRYAAYAGDSGCAGLRVGGPAPLPNTGGGDASSAHNG